MSRRLFATFGGLAFLAIGTPHAGAAVTGPRWTEATPDAMIDAQKARALGGKATERDALAAIATIGALESRAAYGKARQALEEIGEATALPLDVREEAKLAARALAADAGAASGVSADRARGLVTGLALLGPFRDTGGGLAAKEGPEGPGGALSDTKASYSWGTVEVAWRALPTTYATARGVPLDLFVHPRRESCSIVASRVTVDKAQPIVVHLAATGTARLMFDNMELGRAEEVATKASFDRLAGRVDATAGVHVAWAKICTGALPDEGRVRMRLTDPKGAPLALETSADLRGVPSGGKAGTAARAQAKVPTALARALAVEANADPEQVLDAIVLRTLGGADDAKSPRAPGLLDALTRKKDLDADRMAMAGWVAPSGANRSGWLNLARERAEKEGDGKAKGFVDRRIIAEHLTAKMADWAMASMRGAKLDAADAEAVLIRAHIDQELGTDALRTKALRDLTAFFRANAKATPNAMVSDLVTSAAPFNPTLALEASEELARRGLAGSHFVAARAQTGKQGVVDAAKIAFEGSLDDADEALRIAHDVSRAGAHDVARALFARLVEWAPNRPETWTGLADEMAVAPDTMRGGGSPVLAALRRARELSPGDARTRAALKLRSSGDGETREGEREDEKYITPIATILARRQGTQAKGAQDVSARDLHFLRAVIMQPDNRVSQLIHYAREIVISPRTQDELVEEIPAEGDETEILRARVHRKDGGTAFPLEEKNDGDRPRIRWPELAPGDVVEVAVRTWTDHAVGGRGDPPYYFLDYAGATSVHPLIYNEVIVEAPPEHPIYVDVINAAPNSFEKTEKDENGRHVTRLVWQKPVTIAEEPLAPAMTEIVPVIAGSTFKSW